MLEGEILVGFVVTVGEMVLYVMVTGSPVVVLAVETVERMQLVAGFSVVRVFGLPVAVLVVEMVHLGVDQEIAGMVDFDRMVTVVV